MGLGKLNPGCGCACETVVNCPPCTNCTCYEDSLCTLKSKLARVRYSFMATNFSTPPPYTFTQTYSPQGSINQRDAHVICDLGPIGSPWIQLRFDYFSRRYEFFVEVSFTGTSLAIRPLPSQNGFLETPQYANWTTPVSCKCSEFAFTLQPFTHGTNLPTNQGVLWWIPAGMVNSGLALKAEAFTVLV